MTSRPSLELTTPSGLPLPSIWPAGVLGENGWSDGPPISPRVHNIYDDVDQYGIAVETYDGRDKRTDYYNVFQDPMGSGQLVTVEWFELIWKWSRWRPLRQEEGMYRFLIVLPPIAPRTSRRGWVTIRFWGPSGKQPDGSLPYPELLDEIRLTVER